MKNRIIILAVVAAAALAACDPGKTQDYYASHPDELAADLAACKAAGKNTFNCNEATKAEIMLRAKLKQ